jgi:hypothetical protein
MEVVEMYEPKPINTKNIVLPEELLGLTECIAENVHEVWSQGRINEGWVYGEHKNEVLKTTPLLVKYKDLSEQEKEYDRRTALETIKLIIKLGYEVKAK